MHGDVYKRQVVIETAFEHTVVVGIDADDRRASLVGRNPPKDVYKRQA